MSVAFPLRASANGRNWEDQNGVRFTIVGDSSWDWTHNLTSSEIDAYLADRIARGFNAFLLYYSPISYFQSGNPPWAKQLGGSAAGTAALPFTQNTSGGAWNGDPTFANHDANFAFPNDAFFAWLLTVAQKVAAYNAICVFFVNYQGFNHGAGWGDQDGWAKTLQNSSNGTNTAAKAFGTYLANGHGTFAGFKGQGNLIYVIGGDGNPTNGGSLALLELSILQGIQQAGDNKPWVTHIQRNFLNTDQTDWSSSLAGWTGYSSTPTYGENRATFALSPTKPTFSIESDYLGTTALARSGLRYNYWGTALACVGGLFFGFGPVWGFWTNTDGQTGGSPNVSVGSTSWLATTAYGIQDYVSKGGNYYRCIGAGTSGSTGPSGTGSSISDGSVTWTFVAAVSAGMGGMQNLLGDPGVTDFQALGNLMQQVPWHRLVPEAIGSRPGTIVTAGQGTAGTFTDGNPMSGQDGKWIPSAASDDGRTLVAYVPTSHTGTFTVDLRGMVAPLAAYWIDPTTGARTRIGTLSNSTTTTLTVPASANAGGDNDWGLLCQLEQPVPVEGVLGIGLG